MPWEIEFWDKSMRQTLDGIADWLPRLGAAVVLLLVGWAVARLVQAALAAALLRLGVDRLAERLGAGKVLQDLGLGTSLVKPLSRLVYWLILLIFVLAALESLGMQQVSEAVGAVVAFLPRVLAAIFTLLFGALAARLAGNALGAMAEHAGIRGGTAAGTTARFVLLAFVVILVLEELGLATDLLVSIATVLIASLALALAIAFGWGSRGLARNIMAGFHARDVFVIGQRLSVNGHTGRLLSIGPVKATIETDAGAVSLPNYLLAEEEVTILAEDEDVS